MKNETVPSKEMEEAKIEFEEVEKELIDEVSRDAEESSLKKYGVYNDHDDEVRAEKKKKHAKEGFHDTVTFQNQLFHVDELHDPKGIIGKFCVLMSPPQGKDQMMTFSFRTDPKRVKRPVVFGRYDDVVYFLRITFANPEFARIVKLTQPMYNSNEFETTGAFLLRPSDIILPNQLHKKPLNRIIE